MLHYFGRLTASQGLAPGHLFTPKKSTEKCLLSMSNPMICSVNCTLRVNDNNSVGQN
jgi:hypothetical protein